MQEIVFPRFSGGIALLRDFGEMAKSWKTISVILEELTFYVLYGISDEFEVEGLQVQLAKIRV